ncbi:MAG: hypothetical protein HOL16_01290 [Alphaproteobacteria bacterium]|jgi:hypothetical protein|nr:hypothetical protein [Alphaproteobacteria bacterium]
MLRHENNQKPAYYGDKMFIKVIEGWALCYHLACASKCRVDCELKTTFSTLSARLLPLQGKG